MGVEQLSMALLSLDSPGATSISPRTNVIPLPTPIIHSTALQWAERALIQQYEKVQDKWLRTITQIPLFYPLQILSLSLNATVILCPGDASTGYHVDPELPLTPGQLMTAAGWRGATQLLPVLADYLLQPGRFFPATSISPKTTVAPLSHIPQTCNDFVENTKTVSRQ